MSKGPDKELREQLHAPRVFDGVVMRLAQQYNKPPEFVSRCLVHHKVQLPLPRLRYADDGLNDFFSDMTSHFDLTPSLTRQEFVEECDVNNILTRFKQTGDVNLLNLTERKAMYGDFTGLPDSYHSALNYVKGAEQAFLTIPADVRARFDNDPQKLLNFMSDPKNCDELVSLGLVKAPETPPTGPKGPAEPSSGPRDPDGAVGPSSGSK